MPHHMSVSKQPSQIISQKPFSQSSGFPYKQEQAVTQENPRTVRALILSKIRQIQGRISVLRKCQFTPQRTSATDRAELRPHSLNPHNTPIGNKDYFFTPVLSDKNNPSSLEFLVCWTCWAQELLNQLKKIHTALPWVLQGLLYGFECHTD